MTTDWNEAKEEMRHILTERAKLGDTISYKELTKKVTRITFEPHSQTLDTMLEEISVEEDSAGRGMLTVIVVRKHGDMQPGRGFFKLAKTLGRDTSDIEKCWINELKWVFGK